ncbi:TetR/AcrR family transcriptional regulator [Alicyclobacillus sp.]|uniref:TetR/AcrR family transcriptional regulator n=1 Tax=Alicyclobacillus sp. TaxID=61169 RepID=UPI0025C6E884|nr:TetR/AcrR family transcriptional regulator [Alicyclobacillus sp.]MCL6515471.1 TetR/AcrR family transcriptional regulator [Alicyclobacillus sp.]
MAITIESNVKDPDRIRERRAQIVQAAVKLFTEKGFHKTTTREIARESGLSNGAVYEYVKSKEDILFLVCQHIHRAMREQLEASLSPAESGAGRLRQAIRAFYGVIERMQTDILLIYQESKSLPSPYLREVLREEQAITDVFADLLRAGVADGSIGADEREIPLLAHDIVVMGQMWAFRRWGLHDVSFTEFVEQQVDILLEACKARFNA